MPDNKDPEDTSAQNNPTPKISPNEKKARKLTLPSQIPLLEDVISDLTTHTEHTIKATPKKKKAIQEIDPLDKPLATDLFGDPIHSYAVNIENTHTIDPGELHSQASQVIDSLVKEYSHEIVRRLHNELTSVLNDLTEEKVASQSSTGKPPSFLSKQAAPKEADPEQDQ